MVIVMDSTGKPHVGQVTGVNKLGWVMVETFSDRSIHFSGPLRLIEYSYRLYVQLSKNYAYKNALERLSYAKSQLVID